MWVEATLYFSHQLKRDMNVRTHNVDSEVFRRSLCEKLSYCISELMTNPDKGGFKYHEGKDEDGMCDTVSYGAHVLTTSELRRLLYNSYERGKSGDFPPIIV
jgi:hypothetical protein